MPAPPIDPIAQPLLPFEGLEVDLRPPSAQRALEWIAVLSAREFDYRLARDGRKWVIHVSAMISTDAQHEIDVYEWEQREARELRAAAAALRPLPDERYWSPAWVCGFLVTIYAWFGSYSAESPVLVRAASNRSAILSGELWRVVTALTLHAGLVHLGGNLLCLLLLGQSVCVLYGTGFGWALILLSGIAGNATSLLFHGPYQVSVGASTAAFGALGILAGRQAWRRWRRIDPVPFTMRRYAWIPLGAGFGLLAVLGSGAQSDLGAHLCGFAWGVGLGAAFAKSDPSSVPMWRERAWHLACIAVVMTAWRFVLQVQ